MKQIILLHGAIGAADQLEPLRNLLSKQNFEIFSFSFSGHGKTVFKNEFGIEVFAEELEHFILTNKLEGATIFGYSMGGFVALYLASKKPNLIGRIITLGTKFDWNKETALKESKMLNPESISSKVPKFAEALSNRHGEEQWKILLSKTAGMMINLAEKNLLSNEALTSIQCPVMLGLSDKDNMVSYDETRNVFTHLQNVSMYMLPNSKHPIEQVNTELLAQIILNFLT